MVEEAGDGQFTQFIQVGSHELLADEQLDTGGNNRGPDPYSFILIGLGACTSMTLRMYATQHNIPLKKICITLTHQKAHHEDLLCCEMKDERLDIIRCVIDLQGDLTDDQKKQFLEVAEKCPIHKTLMQPPIIKTTLG